MNSVRLQKLESAITQHIMLMIHKGAIKDPRVQPDISITRVQLAKDVSLVKVYISGYRPKKELQKTCDGLNSASGIIRRGLGEAMQTRNTPKPIFFLDESLKEEFYLAQRIMQANREAGIAPIDVNTVFPLDGEDDPAPTETDDE